MPTGRMSRVIHSLRRVALEQDGGPADGQLLARFVAQRDGDAFAALLRRHGPMVMGVCRRVLLNQQDAEDAFQATFLVFARKAATITAPAALGGWLYRVAYRTALEARARISRRRAREQQVNAMPQTVEPEDCWRELLPLVDRELNHLPEKYRVPLVLCELQGRTRKEVARTLGLPEGTLSWRLAHAKKLLARRLSRSGAALSVSALSAVLARDAVSASVPRSVLNTTASAALRIVTGEPLTAGTVSAHVVVLTEGVLKAMLLNKLKAVWALVLVVAVGAGALALTYRPAGAQSPAPRSNSQSSKFLPGTNAPRVAAGELEELRLEIAALRKGLEVTRERVKVLEGEVQTLKANRAARDERTSAAEMLLRAREPDAALIYRQALLSLAAQVHDPLAKAEAALKKLRANPKDKQAADALEKAVQWLRQQQQGQDPKMAPDKPPQPRVK